MSLNVCESLAVCGLDCALCVSLLVMLHLCLCVCDVAPVFMSQCVSGCVDLCPRISVLCDCASVFLWDVSWCGVYISMGGTSVCLCHVCLCDVSLSCVSVFHVCHAPMCVTCAHVDTTSGPWSLFLRAWS